MYYITWIYPYFPMDVHIPSISGPYPVHFPSIFQAVFLSICILWWISRPFLVNFQVISRQFPGHFPVDIPSICHQSPSISHPFPVYFPFISRPFPVNFSLFPRYFPFISREFPVHLWSISCSFLCVFPFNSRSISRRPCPRAFLTTFPGHLPSISRLFPGKRTGNERETNGN